MKLDAVKVLLLGYSWLKTLSRFGWDVVNMGYGASSDSFTVMKPVSMPIEDVIPSMNVEGVSK